MQEWMVDVVDDAQLTSGKSIRLPYRGLSIIRPSPLARNVEEEKALHEKNCHVSERDQKPPTTASFSPEGRWLEEALSRMEDDGIGVSCILALRAYCIGYWAEGEGSWRINKRIARAM